MSLEHERLILGAIIQNPDLFRAAEELTVSDFSIESHRRVFRTVAELIETEQPAQLEVAIVGDKTDPALVVGLLAGLQRVTPEVFAYNVGELKREKLRRRVAESVNAALRSRELETGELRGLLDQYDASGSLKLAQPLTVPLAAIEPRPVDWLWPNYFPAGKLSLISGDPGSGKSFFALDLASRISRGTAWPDGSPNSAAGDVIYLSIEDEASDTIRPRVDGLGGDPTRIHILPSEALDLSDADGIKELEQEIKRLPSPRLVVLDPVLDFSAAVNPNAAEQVRGLLNPLTILAARYKVSLLLIAHLNKAQNFEALYRSAGSVSGWVGKVRAAFMIFRDKDDHGRRYFRASKTNLSPTEPAQFAFRITEGRLDFERLSNDVDLDVHLSPERRESAPQLAEAVKFLRTVLADGPMASRDLFREARELRLSEHTIRRAGATLKVAPERIGGKGAAGFWTWRMP